jgi:hypothetical protein
LGEVQPGESGSVTYEGTLGSLPVGATKVENAATISSAEMEPVTAKVSISVEVVPTQEPTAPPADQPLESFVKDPKYTVAFVVILAFGGIGGLIIATWRIPASAEAGNQRFLLIVEGITVCLILCTVIVLAFGQGIPTPAATSIISGVAGYVLGRSRAGVRPEELVKKKESAATEERPSPPPPTEPNA